MTLEDISDSLPLLEDGDNVCVALSGGLDSTTLVHLLVYKYGKDRVKSISFNYGQRHTIELGMAKKTAVMLEIEHNEINLDYIKDISKGVCALISDSELEPRTAEENSGNPQVNTYVPFRNAQFAYITAAYAECKKCRYIFQGLNAVDGYGYWDTTMEFMKSINDTLQLNRQNQILFKAPFVELYKEDEILLANELSVYFKRNILEHTWSCYNGILEKNNNKHCAKCNTCTELLKGYITTRYHDNAILNKFNITLSELEELKEMYITKDDEDDAD